MAIGSGDIRIIDAAGPTTLTTIPVTDAAQVAVSANEFSLVITSAALPTPGSTYYLEMDAGTVTDFAGNPFAGISDPSTWRFTVSSDAPTVVSIENTPAASPIYGMPVIPYTVTFDKFYMDDDTVNPGDFVNAGTAGITVGALTRVSAALEPAVYTFDVTPTSFGTVQLQINGSISDTIGNALVVPVTDDTTLTLDAGPEPTKQTITLDDFISINAGGSTKTFTFNASGSDKLVVVGTGEHNFGGNLSGKVKTVTYDGEPLIKAVEQLPVRSNLQTTSSLWYLDDPASYHTAGEIVVTVEGNGNNYVETAIGLSGTAPGFNGASAITVGTPAVDMIVSSPNSFVLSWLTLGGSGNTSGTATSVSADSPAGAVTFGGVASGGNYAGQVLAHTSSLTPDSYTFSFGTGLTDVLCLAAEFLAAEPPVTDYLTWAAIYAPADLTDPAADYDGDGMTNDEERLFGLDPTSGTSVSPFTIPLDPVAGTFSFTRRDPSLTGKFTDVETSTDLMTWTVDAGAVLVAGAPDANGVQTVAVTLSPTLLTVPKLFARVKQRDAAVLLSENFETSDGGFTILKTSGSDWAWGDPDSNGFGGTVSGGNGGSTNCWGTNIGNPGYYITPTLTCLRSVEVDLTNVDAAELTFAEALDLEANDSAVVNIIESATDTVISSAIYTAVDSDPLVAAWAAANGGAPIPIPQAAIGQKVRIEWCLDGKTIDYFGWYIDDVMVQEVAP
jgi:hypothetical protein